MITDDHRFDLDDQDYAEEEDYQHDHHDSHHPAAKPLPTYYVTHTQTLSVTITETTLVQKDGQTSTHTLLLTKTQTSTLVDTVTEFHTLVQPTKILSTVTTTIPLKISATLHHDSSASSIIISPSRPQSSKTTSIGYGGGTISSHNMADDQNDSILVVVSDTKKGTLHMVPSSAATPITDNASSSGSSNIGKTAAVASSSSPDVQVPDETNEINPNDILYSGIFTQSTADNECRPECKLSKNEICHKHDKTTRCVCRPGFARMFPDHPCKRKYYRGSIVVFRLRRYYG